MSTLWADPTAVPAPLAYAVIGGLVFAEAALFFGFVIPGETAVIIGAVLAALGHRRCCRGPSGDRRGGDRRQRRLRDRQEARRKVG